MTSVERRYDEPALVAVLSGLDRDRQVVFAATCAERLLPAYARFHQKTGLGDPATLRLTLDAAWAQIQEDQESLAEGYRETLDALTPGECADWSVETGLAENAAASVGYTIDVAMEGGPQDAAWAARQVYEATDLWVRNRDDVDFNVEGAEERVLADPIVQAELGRQQRDLTELVHGKDRSLAELATFLRRRAAVDAGGLPWT
jgi:hypothetical protein